MVLIAEGLPIQVEVIEVPGAKMSTTDPKLEYEARARLDWMAATVKALAAEAGDVLAASTLLLPAATAKKTPASFALLTALLRVAE
jgi:hypothetical protein